VIDQQREPERDQRLMARRQSRQQRVEQLLDEKEQPRGSFSASSRIYFCRAGSAGASGSSGVQRSPAAMR
jgi:hypothetical protein